jgi:hypothetical protein
MLLLGSRRLSCSLTLTFGLLLAHCDRSNDAAEGSERDRSGGMSGDGDEDAGHDRDEDAGSDDAAAPSHPEAGRLAGITAAHNAVRAQVDTGDPLPELKWSEAIAKHAQRWADTLADECASRHRVPNEYGENLAVWGARPDPPMSTAEAIVAGWAAEVTCWEYGTSRETERCDATCAEGMGSDGCWHYTQIVWRDTRELGCGFATCVVGPTHYDIWVCNYDPYGNVQGVAPY